MVQIRAFVVGCLWLGRSRRLAEALPPRYRHRKHQAFIWTGWFLPIVNFWYPYLVVRDVHRATVGPAARGAGAWWAWFLTTDVVAVAIYVVVAGFALSDSAQYASYLPWLEAALAALTAATGALWVRIVREVAARQRARVAALAA
ncbi:DUF4328 domain-containing protein [Antribacter sp. KLBMP9083]|uniref:DUF4328 domain-containing protein n=1 Tax=Antribacter soli TaxID=2910976 RepID=A0AA41U8F8_9MICO|nr:DUF4328 domain-containing protein [Antribacter soli]MCF4122968.1 DUF4328 domain-containing protein [Antribacter soli]